MRTVQHARLSGKANSLLEGLGKVDPNLVGHHENLVQPLCHIGFRQRLHKGIGTGIAGINASEKLVDNVKTIKGVVRLELPHPRDDHAAEMLAHLGSVIVCKPTRRHSRECAVFPEDLLRILFDQRVFAVFYHIDGVQAKRPGIWVIGIRSPTDKVDISIVFDIVHSIRHSSATSILHEAAPARRTIPVYHINYSNLHGHVFNTSGEWARCLQGTCKPPVSARPSIMRARQKTTELREFRGNEP